MVKVKAVRDHQARQTGIMRRVALGARISVDSVVHIRTLTAPALDRVMYPVIPCPRSVLITCSTIRVNTRLRMTLQAEAAKLRGCLGDLVCSGAREVI